MELIYVLLGIAAILVIGAILIYNTLVSKRNRCDQAFADIDVQLKQRQNLIPNLVETVKGYASHERETLDEVVQARNSAMAAGTAGEKAATESILSSALAKLFALAESYPDLKASQNFQQLQEELAIIEDKLAAARRFYNSAVQDYNTAREQFPGSLIAGTFDFEGRAFFNVGGEARATLSQVPKVDFS